MISGAVCWRESEAVPHRTAECNAYGFPGASRVFFNRRSHDRVSMCVRAALIFFIVNGGEIQSGDNQENAFV